MRRQYEFNRVSSSDKLISFIVMVIDLFLFSSFYIIFVRTCRNFGILKIIHYSKMNQQHHGRQILCGVLRCYRRHLYWIQIQKVNSYLFIYSDAIFGRLYKYNGWVAWTKFNRKCNFYSERSVPKLYSRWRSVGLFTLHMASKSAVWAVAFWIDHPQVCYR